MRKIVDGVMKQIPTYVVRYEDLLANQEGVLSELMCFLLGKSDLR